MQRRAVFPSTHISPQSGFSLIEVLVALLVLSIGLLGLAALQTTGLRFNTQSYQRTQAVLNAYDIMDRIRANPGAMSAGSYDNISKGYTAPATDCVAATCSTAQLADYDIGQWKTSLTNLLSQGQGAICRGTLDASFNCTLAGGTMFMVGVEWVENDLPMRVTVEAEL